MTQSSTRERLFPVDAQHDGWRLDLFLASRLRRLSRSQAHVAIARGGVALVPPRTVKAALRVRVGDVVRLREQFDEDWLDDAVELLLERPTFLAFAKPAGMLVHPTARAHGNCLTSYAERQGYSDLKVVHRLDRETSGVLLLARGRDAARRLAGAFAHGLVEKSYRAIAVDPGTVHPTGSSGCIDVPLGFDHDSEHFAGLKIGRGTWAARTHYRCLARVGELAELEVRIEGGRQHQIRVHLAMLGTPLLGDKLYGRPDAFYKDFLEGRASTAELGAERHALHAFQLRFREGDEDFAIEAPLPPDFASWLAARGSATASPVEVVDGS